MRHVSFRTATRDPASYRRRGNGPMALGPDARLVIVGGGAAGVAAAETFRRYGHRGPLTILGGEPEGFYDRPACAKGVLTGEKRPRDTRLPVDAPGADRRWGRSAVALDQVRHVVTDDNGEEYHYDGLVLATGARAVPPAGWPYGEPGLYPLRTLTDAWAVRRSLRRAESVAIIGGGLTGCEVASAVLAQARTATIVDSHRYLMGRALGKELGTVVTRSHRRAGIGLRLGRRVAGLTRRRGRWRLDLDDGTDLIADVVVITTGERPETGWLRGVGFDLADGILCDARLRPIGGDGYVVAAGTVARWPNLRFGPEPVRCGQWIAAGEQGRAAARVLLAGDLAEPVTLLPRFWSQQLDLRIQVCGQIGTHTDVTITELRPGREDAARAGIHATYYRNGQLIGAAAVNAAHAFTISARTLLATPPPAAAQVRTAPFVPSQVAV